MKLSFEEIFIWHVLDSLTMLLSLSIAIIFPTSKVKFASIMPNELIQTSLDIKINAVPVFNNLEIILSFLLLDINFESSKCIPS